LSQEGRHIALYGGAFDPPHLCHVLAVGHILAMAQPDEVWLLPCHDHAFQKEMTPFHHRVEMTRRAVHPVYGAERISVSLAEYVYKTSYTIDTVERLQQDFPNDRFTLAVGTDVIDERDKWHRWDDLVKLIQIHIIPRGGYERCQGAFTLPELSSTTVREALWQQNPWVLTAVPPTVRAYIDEHGLYRT